MPDVACVQRQLRAVPAAGAEGPDTLGRQKLLPERADNDEEH